MEKFKTKKALVTAINELTPFTAVNEYGELVRIELKAAQSSSLNSDKNGLFRRSKEWEQITELFGKNRPMLYAGRYRRTIVFTDVNEKEY